MELMEPGRQVWLLSVEHGSVPVLARGLSFLVCEMGAQCLHPTRFGHIGGHNGVRLSWPHQTSCRLQSPAARASSQTLSLLTVLLIWHLETLGDKQCHLNESHGKSQGCGEPAGGSTLLGGLTHGPHCLVREQWEMQAPGSILMGPQAGFGQFAFDPVAPRILMHPPSFQSPHALLLV